LRVCNGQLADAASKDSEEQDCVHEMLHAMSTFLSGQDELRTVQMKERFTTTWKG
jgi:hypothetical protein